MAGQRSAGAEQRPALRFFGARRFCHGPNNGRHTVVPLRASIQEHYRGIGFDNLAPIIWHKIANAAYEVEGGGRFLGKPEIFARFETIVAEAEGYSRATYYRMKAQLASVYAGYDGEGKVRYRPAPAGAGLPQPARPRLQGGLHGLAQTRFRSFSICCRIASCGRFRYTLRRYYVGWLLGGGKRGAFL